MAGDGRHGPIGPRTCPDLPVHPSLLDKARELAAAGDIKGASAISRRVAESEPNLTDRKSKPSFHKSLHDSQTRRPRVFHCREVATNISLASCLASQSKGTTAQLWRKEHASDIA